MTFSTKIQHVILATKFIILNSIRNTYYVHTLYNATIFSREQKRKFALPCFCFSFLTSPIYTLCMSWLYGWALFEEKTFSIILLLSSFHLLVAEYGDQSYYCTLKMTLFVCISLVCIFFLPVSFLSFVAILYWLTILPTHYRHVVGIYMHNVHTYLCLLAIITWQNDETLGASTWFLFKGLAERYSFSLFSLPYSFVQTILSLSLCSASNQARKVYFPSRNMLFLLCCIIKSD